MPQFKAHISFGLVLAIGVVALAVSYSIVTDDYVLGAIFAAIVVGTILPDLDSDKGTPFKIALNILAVILGISVFTRIKSGSPDDIFMLIAAPVGTYFFVRYVIGYVLTKFTHHRGIIHSIPVAVIAFFVAQFFLEGYSFDAKQRSLIAMALTFGFLGHLVLDEAASLVGWKGILPKVDRSFGSAFKLWSGSFPVTASTYVVLLYLIYQNRLELQAIMLWVSSMKM